MKSPRVGVWRQLLAEMIPVTLIVLVPLGMIHANSIASLLPDSSTTEVDTLQSETPVAEEFSILHTVNNPDPQAARGGGDAIIEDGVLVSAGIFGDDAIAESRTVNGEISVYVVREGDSLSQIAEMYDVTTNTILWANDIDSATDIQPGDTLVILPIVGVRHVVKDGDTIGTIAKKYEGDVDEILAYNRLNPVADLQEGDTVIIPGGAIETTVTVAAKSSGGSSSGGASVTGLAHPLPGAQRTQGIHGYNGVDLAAGAGTPIRAAAAGEVIVSKSGGWNGGYGNYVVIKHPNGVQTLYAHNSRNAVGVGAYVTQGQTIGYVGNTGRSTGAHLHFEVRGGRNPF